MRHLLRVTSATILMGLAVIFPTTAAFADDEAPATPLSVAVLPDPLPQSSTFGNLALEWGSDLADISGYTLVLNDATDAPVTSVDVAADVTTYVFPHLASGQYSVTVTAHGSAGDTSATTMLDDIANANSVSSSGVTAYGSASLDGAFSVTVNVGDSSPTATGYDIVLLDSFGTTVASSSIAGSDNSTQFDGVTSLVGLTAQVTAHDTFYGDETFTAVDVTHVVPVDDPDIGCPSCGDGGVGPEDVQTYSVGPVHVETVPTSDITLASRSDSQERALRPTHRAQNSSMSMGWLSAGLLALLMLAAAVRARRKGRVL